MNWINTHFLAFMSAMFVFWITEFGVLAFARSWMIRDEIIQWCMITAERRRVIALLLGLGGISIFMTFWIGRTMLVWMSGRWSPNLFSVLVLVVGLISVQAMMWWGFCTVLGEQRGWKAWLLNLWIGIAIGAVAGCYTLDIIPRPFLGWS